MGNRPDKRARKKEHRDRVLAQQAAELRRRKMIRIGVIALVLLAVMGIVAGSFMSGDDPAPEEEASGPTLPEGCERTEGREDLPPRYQDEPEMQLEKGVDYGAVIQTSCGEIEMDLLERRAPRTVNNFVFLAREGYFDGLLWHRIEQNAVLQSGDPNGLNGQPPDDPGYEIPDELQGVEPNDYVYGVVGMANAGPGTGGSQFFIVIHDYEGAQGGDPEPATYPPSYTIFGEVAESSWATLQTLGKVPINADAPAGSAEAVQPKVPVFVDSIEITES